MVKMKDKKAPPARWRSLGLAKSLLATSLLAGLLLLPLPAAAGTIEGKINGLRCVTDGVACPVDKQDPVISSVSDFVVQQSDGTYFFIHNIPLRTKARHALETVRVTGEVDLKYRSVKAVRMEVLEQGSYRRVWTPRRTTDDLRMPGASRR